MYLGWAVVVTCIWGGQWWLHVSGVDSGGYMHLGWTVVATCIWGGQWWLHVSGVDSGGYMHLGWTVVVTCIWGGQWWLHASGVGSGGYMYLHGVGMENMADCPYIIELHGYAYFESLKLTSGTNLELQLLFLC